MSKKPETTLRELAPHAEPGWVDAFVVEQRLLGVPGPRIGDALATVEGHLAETGEEAQEAFGPAQDYARSLAESEEGRTPGVPGVGSAMLSAVCGLVGIVLLPRALTAGLEATSVTVTSGDLVGAGLLAALTALVVLRSEAVLRFLLDHKAAPFLAGPILVATFVAVFLLWRQPVAALPVVVVLLGSVAALAASTIIGLRTPTDLVESPSGATLGSARGARLATALVAPVCALLMCLLSWIVWALS